MQRALIERSCHLAGAVFCATAVMLSASVVRAATPMTAAVIEVRATDDSGREASYSQAFPVNFFDGRIEWGLESPISLVCDDGQPLATIESLNVGYDADPIVDLAFSLRNSDLGNPTFFSITSTTISFGGINPATGVATASMSITNGIGGPAGVSSAGQFPGNKAYQARYSTDSVINTGTVFANLVDSLSAVIGTSQTEETNGGLFVAIPGTIYMMESQYQFILSAGDQASGTSHFEIVPEPATLGLLLVGGLMVAARRRRAA